MTDSKLSALPTGTAIQDSDLFYSVQESNSVKQPASALKTYASVSPILTGTPTAPTAIAGTNTTQIATTAFVLASGGRIKLTSNTTYNVSPSGNDTTGDGSVGNPWATLQYASDYLTQKIDLAGFTATIQAANNSTAYAAVKMAGYYSSIIDDNGGVYFKGDNTTPANVKATSFTLNAPSSCRVYVGGFSITATSAIPLIEADPNKCGGSSITLGGPNFASAKMTLVYSGNWFALAGNIRMESCDLTLDCTAGSPGGFYFGTANSFGTFTGNGVTIVGSPTWNRAFIRADVQSYSEYFITFSGTASGKRFIIQAGGEIYIPGGVTTLPGSTVGNINSGGMYVDGTTGGGSDESAAIMGIAALADQRVNYQTPTTGFNITVKETDGHLILDPAGTLASGTVTMSPNPVDGLILNIRTSKTITTFTLAPNTGQTIVGSPSTLSAGSGLSLIYKLSNTTWYCGV